MRIEERKNGTRLTNNNYINKIVRSHIIYVYESKDRSKKSTAVPAFK